MDDPQIRCPQFAFQPFRRHQGVHVLLLSRPGRTLFPSLPDHPAAALSRGSPAYAPIGAFSSAGPSSAPPDAALQQKRVRSEEHTSELQSLMRISYAVFCLKKKTTSINTDISAISIQNT